MVCGETCEEGEWFAEGSLQHAVYKDREWFAEGSLQHVVCEEGEWVSSALGLQHKGGQTNNLLVVQSCSLEGLSHDLQTSFTCEATHLESFISSECHNPSNVTGDGLLSDNGK